MKKTKILFYAFLLSWFFVQPIKADYSLDDSCTQTNAIMNAILDITTLGLFDAYSESFHMYGADGYGSGSNGTNGCIADWYPDDCTYSEDSTTGEGSSNCSGNAYLHNSSYCQSDGTNCCDDALTCTTDSSTGITSCLPSSTDYIGVRCPTTPTTLSDCSASSEYPQECNPCGGLEFCYDNYDYLTAETTCNGNSTPIWAQDGDEAWYLWPPGQLRVGTDGDKLCVQFNTTLGYQSIGCKYLPSCVQFYLDQSCYVAESCYSYGSQNSLAMLPVTGAIMQCVNETIQYLFYGNPNCSISNDTNMEYIVTSFSDFQTSMRITVRSALFLYIVVFGLKTVLSSELPSKGEFFRMGAQFTLVLYFSTGININGVIGTDGQPYYDDGIHRYMIPLFTTGAAELADMVYTSGGNQGLCIYDSSLYPPGYSYLSMWDGIDCRILYYLGMDLSSIASSIADNPTADVVLTLALLGDPILFGLLLPAFFSFQIVFLLCSTLFIIMFVSVLIYFVNISVISAIVVAIMIYIAPIFVPMALFEATKGYYDGWLKTTTAYALQPMVIAAYFAMMFTIFDQTIFGDCLFKNYSVTFEMGNQTKTAIPFFMLCDPHDSTGDCYNCENDTDACPGYQTSVDVGNENITQCSQTIGYFLNPMVAGTSYTSEVSMIFFDIYLLDSSVSTNMTTGMVTLCLFGYLFYKFGDVIDELTGELTGGSSLGSSAGKPMALVDKAGQKAKELAKYAVSGKKDKPDGSKDKPRGDGSGAKSSSTDKGTSKSGAKSSKTGGGSSASSPPKK